MWRSAAGRTAKLCIIFVNWGGVKFDAHYAITSVDPPELVRFIKTHYPDVHMESQHYSDGKPEHYYPDGRPKPITMWSLIADHTLPPTRKVRYCCAHLKEPGGQGRIVVTGVRWAESANRKNTHGVVGFRGKPKGTAKKADALGADYKLNKYGDVIMNDDNDANRRMVEQCYRTRKTMVNPIVDWTDEDVWDFLNGLGVEHCCLYDEGFTRLGCIGCPLSGSKNMIRDFERWPKYRENYIQAFQRMIDNHPGQIKILDPNADTKFKLYDAIPENSGGGTSRLDTPAGHGMVHATAMTDFAGGGGTVVQQLGRFQLRRPSPCTTAGLKRRSAETVYRHWIELGAI